MFGLRHSGSSQILEDVVKHEMAISLAARTQVDIQLQLYHAHVLWLTASQLWTISIASVFHMCRSYFEYLDVAFPSVIASLPNANALSAPYPAFRKLCYISLNVPNILEHWSLGVELEFVAVIASRSMFLRFSNEGHGRSLGTTRHWEPEAIYFCNIWHRCVSLDEVLYFPERTQMVSWQGQLCCNSAFEEI
jgi:hypothetical protein